MTIYVLRFGALLKIGYSSNLAARVRHIMAGIPGEVAFVGHMPGDRDVEAHLHERFAQSRFQGEWFAQSADLVEFCRIALLPDLPELSRAVPKAMRPESDNEWARVSADFRSAAAKRWPEASHGERKALLADLLGWTPRRVRSLYEAQPGCRLKNHEMSRLSDMLFRADAKAIAPATPGEPNQ